MNPVNAADPATKVVFPFTDVGQLNDAIKLHGYIPIRSNGTPYQVQVFEGGYLLDGLPLNVLIDGVWYDGQQQALQPYWQSGTIPTPPPQMLGIGTITAPPAVAANFQHWQQSQQNILGFPWYYWAAGAAAYLLLR